MKYNISFGVHVALGMALLVPALILAGPSHTTASPGLPSSSFDPGLLRPVSDEPAGDGESRLIFGIFPGGGNDQFGYVPPPSWEQVVDELERLRGDGPYDVHLYTAWNWHTDAFLDSQIDLFTGAGYYVTLTVKYSPPSGRVGDIEGYAAFVRRVVDRHAENPLVHRFAIANEINVPPEGDPGASDGPIPGARDATIAGVRAAHEELARHESAAEVGISLAVLERETDARFLRDLTELGGQPFRDRVDFVGLNIYPGLWPVGTGDPYEDMKMHLRNGRYSIESAGLDASVGLIVLENGFPTTDAGLQATKVEGFLRATCEVAGEVGLTGYYWFDLWDANSASSNPYAHYGLLTSDLKPKPGYDMFQRVASQGCGVFG